MAIPQWSPGTIYNPGDIVEPRSQNIVTQQQPNDNSFESGALTHWASSFPSGGAATVAIASDRVFIGADSVKATAGVGTELRTSATVLLTNDYAAPVKPGKVIKFKCYFNRSNVNGNGLTGVADGGARIAWFTSGMALISYSYADTYPGANSDTPQGDIGGTSPFDTWLASSGTATAPPTAAFASAVIAMRTNNSGGAVWADNFTWDYTFQGIPAGLSFVAVQPVAGTSAAKEPVWPLTAGLTVVDGGVTWQAEFASRITWTASALLTSGNAEPTWPNVIGAHVLDGASPSQISWVAVDGRVTDPNCPQSKIVAIAQSKVFAGDTDTIPFSATTNCLDWTTPNDAGYLPFGLQTYGNEPLAALGLYRSNLIAMNSLGYQMWQIDPDPANMALLDAEPVGCSFPKSISPVQNDMVFLTTKGIRSIGMAGASGNIQAGQFGKNLDPIVIASIAGGTTPRGLFYPGTGQYWLCFGSTVYVMTNNGSGKNSWSQYNFPSSIDAWTVLAGVLYLRSGDLVWQVDEATLLDDSGGNNNVFTGVIWWPFLDLGPIGSEKNMEGIDLVITGTCKINILYNESDLTQMTPDYAMSGDTLPGFGLLPFEVSAPSFGIKLTFDGNQAWEWDTTNIYIESEDGA